MMNLKPLVNQEMKLVYIYPSKIVKLLRSIKYIVFLLIILWSNLDAFSQGLEMPVFSYKPIFDSIDTDKEILADLDYLDKNWYCIENKEEYILEIRDQLSNKKQIQFLNLLNSFRSNKRSEIEKANAYLYKVKNDSILYLPGRYYLMLAFVSSASQNTARSIEYANKAIHFFEEAGYNEGLILTYRRLIDYYAAIDEIEIATEYFSRSLLLCEKINYNIGLANTYKSYAKRISLFDTAYAGELFRKSYEIIKAEQSQYLYIQVATEYLRYSLRFEDRTTYLKLYNEVMSQIENDGICAYSLLGIINTFQAHYYSEVDNIDSAIFFNLQALKLRKKDGNKMIIGLSYLNLFSNYLFKNKLDSAGLWLDSARNDLFENGSLESKRYFINHEIRFLQKQNQKDSILQNYKLLMQIETEYNLEQKQILSKNLKAKNDINIKLQEEKYQLELSKKQNRFIYLSLIIVLTIIIIVFLLIRIRSKNLRVKNLSLVSQIDKIALQEYKREIEQLKNIFENATKGFFIIDKQLKISFHNAAANELIDHFKKVSIEKYFENYIPLAHKDEFTNTISEVNATHENQEIQVRYPGENGEVLDYNFSISPMIVNNRLESILLIITDITKSSKAFESEKQQRRILQLLINSVSESIILIDVNRKIRLLNTTAALRLGNSEEDLIDKSYFKIVPERLRNTRENKLSEVFETGKMVVFNEEISSNHYIISYYPSMNPDGNIEYVSEFTQDITEKRLATERINSLRQKVLRSQMNPHFIFNSLNAIQSYVLKNDAYQAVRYLNSFARLIRMILDSSRFDYITLSKEIDLLEYYLELQQLRFEDKFVYQMEIDNDLDTQSLLIPAMLAQPFIENSIEHGLQHLEDKGTVKISFDKVKDNIVFKVVDNGIGREASHKIQEKIRHKESSLSTQLFEERLHTLNKFLGKKISYNILDLKNDNGAAKGTMVIIHLPMIYNSDVNYN